jgi:spermidine/putrescine transport system permease protein
MIQFKKIKKYGFFILIIPALLLVIIFFLIPSLTLIWLSLHIYEGPMKFKEGLSLKNYVDIFTSPFYLECFIRTIEIAIISSTIATLLAYPLSYTLAKGETSLTKKLLLIIVIFIFFNSTISRGLSLIFILGPQGILNKILMFLGQKPLEMIHNIQSVIIGLVYITLPFSVFSMLPSIQKIDISLYEMALILGASKVKAFIKIILPLSLSGISTAFSLCLALTLGAFVIPLILGGGVVDMISNVIYYRMMGTLNYALGSALSIILFIFSLLILWVSNKVIRRD